MLTQSSRWGSYQRLVGQYIHKRSIFIVNMYRNEFTFPAFRVEQCIVSCLYFFFAESWSKVRVLKYYLSWDILIMRSIVDKKCSQNVADDFQDTHALKQINTEIFKKQVLFWLELLNQMLTNVIDSSKINNFFFFSIPLSTDVEVIIFSLLPL